jgi:hypothetical protein
MYLIIGESANILSALCVFIMDYLKVEKAAI